MNWQIVCLVLFLLTTEANCTGRVDVPILVKDPRSVCLDGTPAGYYHITGSGDGVNNWLVHLEGGAWCGNPPLESCQNRSTTYLGSTTSLKPVVDYFDGILSSYQDFNPDFFNWNKVFVHYCDGASFIGDTEIIGSGFNLQSRGSRIFNAVMDELLKKGMENATNAMLAGYSAGGLATIVHCDAFRALLPNVGRVKCLSDSGFFVHAKDLPDAQYRESFFNAIINFHNLTDLLPKSCTTRLDAISLCLFPQYVVEDVSTPLFLLNTAFDSYQIQHLLKAEPPFDHSWDNCTTNPAKNYCTPAQKQLIKDFGDAFLQTLKEIGNNPSRGMFINSCYSHVYTLSHLMWNSDTSPRLKNKTIAAAVGDWYYDRSPVDQLIDTQTEFALNC